MDGGQEGEERRSGEEEENEDRARKECSSSAREAKGEGGGVNLGVWKK